MTPREAGDILGKSHLTVIRWCKNGTINAKQKTKGKGRLVWDVPRSEVQRVLKELPPIENPAEKQEEKQSAGSENQAQAPSENIDVNTSPLEDSNVMNRPEVELRIKIEDYKKKLRDNRQKDKELVEMSVVLEVIRIQYTKLYEAFDETIDRWAIEENWPPEKQQKKTADVKIALNRYERKVLREIDASFPT